jgi:hypothetical protein
LPELEALRSTWEPRGVRFIALSLEPDPEKVKRGAKEFGVTMPVAIADGEVLAPLKANQVPSTVFIDSQGVIRMTAAGGHDRRFFERRLKQLTAQER